MRAWMIPLLLATIWMFSSAPASAHECAEIPSLPPLKSATVDANTEAKSVVAALLEDAETIYNEGANIVRRAPKTEVETTALSRMEALGHGGESFHWKECDFQDRLFFVEAGQKRTPSETLIRTLVRMEQFDNFIFMAVNEALDCSNAKAGFDLGLSRQLLDHAWMEFRGHPEQRDWDPDDLDGPASAQRCVDDWPHGTSLEQAAKIVDDQIEKFDRASR
jgi:hypothetical protein